MIKSAVGVMGYLICRADLRNLTLFSFKADNRDIDAMPHKYIVHNGH